MSSVAVVEAVCGPLEELWPLSSALPHAAWMAPALAAVRAAGLAPDAAAMPPSAVGGGSGSSGSAAAAALRMTRARIEAHMVGMGMAAQQVALLAPLLVVDPSSRPSVRDVLSSDYFKAPAEFVGAPLDPRMQADSGVLLRGVLLLPAEQWYTPGVFPAMRPCRAGAGL